METHRFYIPGLEVREVAVPELVTLPAEESHHAVKVLRMQEGDPMELVNGQGWILQAQLLEAHPKKAHCQVKAAVLQDVHPPKIHIAIAPTKNISRFEWFLEKATEIGIGKVTPILCEHSERQHLKPERLEKVLVAAMKQSKRSWKPILNPAIPFQKAIAEFNAEQRLIAVMHPNSEGILSVINKNKGVVILIGPEGDFSPAELSMAFDKGFQPVLLGDSRLRTETAALYALMAANMSASIEQQY